MDGKLVSIAERGIIRPQQGSYSCHGGPNGGILPPNHYRVYMRHLLIPSFAQFIAEFGSGNVGNIYDNGRLWTPHPSCIGIDRTPGERICFLHDVGRDWECEERIAWGLAQRNSAAPNGYRPAMLEEEYDFSHTYPELMDYVAPGSFSSSGLYQFVGVIWNFDGQRFLGADDARTKFRRRYRILFVSI